MNVLHTLKIYQIVNVRAIPQIRKRLKRLFLRPFGKSVLT